MIEKKYMVPPDIRLKQSYMGLHLSEIVISVVIFIVFAKLFVFPYGLSRLPLASLPLLVPALFFRVNPANDDKNLFNFFRRAFGYYLGQQIFAMPKIKFEEDKNEKDS